MTDGTAAPRPLTAVPTIADLLTTPMLAGTLPRAVLTHLYRQVAPLEAHIRAALAGGEATQAESIVVATDWISLDEAAALVGRSRSWLLRRHPRPAWLRRLSRKTFRVNRLALLRWLDSRPS